MFQILCKDSSKYTVICEAHFFQETEHIFLWTFGHNTIKLASGSCEAREDGGQGPLVDHGRYASTCVKLT
jgi:hypothetical protein